MPQRVHGLFLALLGLAAVASLLLVGADVWLAANRGPRWRRALLGAGLALAACLGLVDCGSAPPADAPPPAPAPKAESRFDVGGLEARFDLLEREAGARTLTAEALDRVLGEIAKHLQTLESPGSIGREDQAAAEVLRIRFQALQDLVRARREAEAAEGRVPGAARPPGEEIPDVPKTLADSPEWRKFQETWKEASEIASGSRGGYPFDDAGKKRILDAIGSLPLDLLTLARQGLLSEPEADLLVVDLQDLSAEVGRFRTVAQKNATCYMPLPLQAEARKSLNWIRQRVGLLEKLVAEKGLSSDALHRVFAGFSERLAKMDPENLAALDEKERAEAESLRDRVKALLEASKGR
jgi:hypothetical protein